MKSVLLLTWGPCTHITQGRTNIYAYTQTKFCTLDILITKVFGRYYSHNDHKTGALRSWKKLPILVTQCRFPIYKKNMLQSNNKPHLFCRIKTDCDQETWEMWLLNK